MLCRLQCARCAKRVAHCRRTIRLALGTHTVAACCGSAPNKCASCTGGGRAATCTVGEHSPTLASLAERRVVPSLNERVKIKHAPNKCAWELECFIPSSNVCKSASLNGDIWMKFTPSRNQRFRDGDPVCAKEPIKTMAQAIATRSENE